MLQNPVCAKSSRPAPRPSAARLVARPPAVAKRSGSGPSGDIASGETAWVTGAGRPGQAGRCQKALHAPSPSSHNPMADPFSTFGIGLPGRAFRVRQAYMPSSGEQIAGRLMHRIKVLTGLCPGNSPIILTTRPSHDPAGRRAWLPSKFRHHVRPTLIFVASVPDYRLANCRSCSGALVDSPCFSAARSNELGTPVHFSQQRDLTSRPRVLAPTTCAKIEPVRMPEVARSPKGMARACAASAP